VEAEEVICDQLEVEGRVLAEKVVEHVLTCFRSWDPIVSLDPVVLGLIVGTKGVASSDVEDTAKIVAARF
jgi:hypothetical protein